MSNSKTILFIDDEIICHKVLSLMASNQDCYKFIHAYSASEALNIIEKRYSEISIIVSDISMDDCSGHELFKKLQQNPKFKNIPFILQSGLTSDAEELIFQKNISIPIIYKPYKIEELIKLIDKVTNSNEAVNAAVEC